MTPTPTSSSKEESIKATIERMIIENRDIDSDSINTIGQQDLAIDIQALLTSQKETMLNEILSELPKERPTQIKHDVITSYNAALTEVKALIEKKRKGL